MSAMIRGRHHNGAKNYAVGTIGAALNDVCIHVSRFPWLAKFDGVTDVSSAINAAVLHAESLGGGVVECPKGTGRINSAINLKSGVKLKGQGKHSTKLASGALTYVLAASGALAGTSHNLASNAAKGTRTIVLAAGGGAAYAVGDYALLQAENLPFAGALATQKQAEYVKVQAIAGDALTVRGALAFSYTTANTARLTKLNPVSGFGVEGIGVSSLDPATYARIFASFEYCADFTINECHFENGKSAAVYLLGCVNAEVSDSTAKDLQSDPVTPGAYGYFVCEAGPNIGLKMRGCAAESVRHVYTTVVGGGTATVQPYGFPMYSKVTDCEGLWTFAASFDTHPGAGYGIEFNDCTAFQSNQAGFQVRSEKTQVKGGSVLGATGPAVSVTNYGNDSNIENVTAEDVCTGTDSSGTDWTTKGAFSDNSQNTTWKNPSVKECGGPAFEQVRGGGGTEVLSLRAKNPCRIGATNRAGVAVTGLSGGTVLIDNPVITCADANMQHGILSPNASPQILLSGDYITGASVAKYSIANANSGIVSAKRSSGINGYGKGEVVTVTAGVANIENLGSGYMVLAGEGGVADDLATITGGQDGDMLVLRKAAAPTITVKHGTGNIQLTGNTDHQLVNTFSILTLTKISTQWVEVARRI